MKLYSVRMRASLMGEHISGGERIVPEGKVAAIASDLIKKAQFHPLGSPDEIFVSVEFIDENSIQKGRLLPIKTVYVSDFQAGREAAKLELIKAGIDPKVAQRAIDFLAYGASPAQSNMRGAIVMDFKSDARLEPDKLRGVRVSRLDIAKSAERKLIKSLIEQQIDPNYARDAIALATKVAHVEGSVAELCWSDDPDYTPGYVASKESGYVRFTHLKPKGCKLGGRVFFVDMGKVDLQKYIETLEKQPFLAI